MLKNNSLHHSFLFMVSMWRYLQHRQGEALQSVTTVAGCLDRIWIQSHYPQYRHNFKCSFQWTAALQRRDAPAKCRWNRGIRIFFFSKGALCLLSEWISALKMLADVHAYVPLHSLLCFGKQCWNRALWGTSDSWHVQSTMAYSKRGIGIGSDLLKLALIGVLTNLAY